MITFFSQFSFQEFLTCFFALLAVIDALGATPIIIDLKHKGRSINVEKATVIALVLRISFLFCGEWFLRLFSVDIKSFAIGGSIILFLVALEMLLDVTLFKDQANANQSATLIPIVFPLLAGAATFTTLLSFRSQFATINIITAVLANMIWVYVVFKFAMRAERAFSGTFLYVLRKFFGIILLAISIRLFVDNLFPLIADMQHGMP